MTIEKSGKAMEQSFKKAGKLELSWVNAFCEKKLFGNFYKIFLNTAFLYFHEKNILMPENGFEGLLDQIYERIEKIPVRVLIEDIHKQKSGRKLSGENPREEYQYYQTVLLGDAAYVAGLCEAYPVMKELILHQICLFIEYLCEIEHALKRDKEIIEAALCHNQSFHRVLQIRMDLSDPHRDGKTVAEIVLDNGSHIIYKPRSLHKEALLNQMYQLFAENGAISGKLPRVADMQTYGWEEAVEAKECNTEEEVKRYFERMGFLLFLCYLFGATDIHCENIIPSGEFPVLIDVETIPGIIFKEAPRTAKELAVQKINASVLRTGMPPTMVWGKEGEGVIASALGNGGNMRLPFHLPYISEPYSSEIHISYAKETIRMTGSLPVFQGQVIGAASYADRIFSGFEKAYHLSMELQTQIADIGKHLSEQKSRLIFRHTQQYRMYLNISLYPQFLKSREERDQFFDALSEHKKYPELHPYEKRALGEMNIPFFEADVKNGAVYDGEGNRYRLQNFKIDKEYDQRDRLCAHDLAFQERCIKLSLDLLTERRPPEPSDVKEQEGVIPKEKIVTEIADDLCEAAVVFHGEITWNGLTFYDRRTWRLTPMGLDLYDGLGGIAVFLAGVHRTHPSEKYRKVFQMTEHQLFAYTDGKGQFAQTLGTKESGIFQGEGSIVHTYLLLYKITGDGKYLSYAEKHYSQFESVFLQCEALDYLSGCAGAVIVLTKLYRETANPKYLDAAEMLGEKIWKMAKKQKEGYGIVSGHENFLPLAGMAHGTSGYLMAYAYLYEQLQKPEYYERITALLAYENSLFDPEAGNWKDLRETKGGEPAAAWCHGAPGIALARLKLYGLEGFGNMREIEEDLWRCRYALQRSQKTDSLCLCHGLAGNYWIEKYLFEKQGIPNEPKVQKDFIEMLHRVGEPSGMLPRERYHVSLMTGITGIGMLLNDEMICRELFL